jgi:hypothetical protein
MEFETSRVVFTVLKAQRTGRAASLITFNSTIERGIHVLVKRLSIVEADQHLILLQCINEADLAQARYGHRVSKHEV